jgi:hypothetical protein
MDDATIRLNCLKIARPDNVINPDAQQIVERAQKFYQFVTQVPVADKAEAPADKPVSRPKLNVTSK